MERDSNDRLEGQKQALQEHNLAFDPDLFFEVGYTDISGHQGLGGLLKQTKAFTGLVSINNEVASGAMQMAR